MCLAVAGRTDNVSLPAKQTTIVLRVLTPTIVLLVLTPKVRTRVKLLEWVAHAWSG